ncbi:MAG: hypothetical protein AB7O98_17570 [Hyphomonadaceae bacterium]
MLLTVALLLLLLIVVTVVALSWEDALKRRGVFVGIGVLGLMLAGWALWASPREALLQGESDAWSAWGQSIDARVAACGETIDGATCLKSALARHAAPPAADDSNAARFFRDMNMGEALLSHERTRDLLWDEFGIDSADFLGTGYSAPRGAGGGYEAARQLEYFVPNMCADVIDTAVCPREVENVWTWRLSATDAAAWVDRSAAEFFATAAPADHAAQWRAQATALSQGALYVRFSRFPAQYYAGTVGRPNADLVFFAALPDPGASTLREIMARTGSAALGEPDAPEDTLFVWVYAPPAPPPAATWSALFDYVAQN